MNKLSKDKTIVCRYGELDVIELVVVLSAPTSLSLFAAMRGRLLKQGNGMFFSDVTLDAKTSEVCATINLYVRENQHFEVFAIFNQELEMLTGDKYCIDCSALHRPPVQRKPPMTRKGN